MHYYQFNIGDYQSHTSHLSDMEDLAYRRLLDWYYLHELPIPLEVTEVARQIRMRTHSDCISSVLQEYFERTIDGWIHHRANKEIAKTGEIYDFSCANDIWNKINSKKDWTWGELDSEFREFRNSIMSDFRNCTIKL